MEPDNGLITAYVLDGEGGGREIDWRGVREWSPGDGVLWVHLDYTQGDAQHWLWRESGLDAHICEALLAEETRPRSVVMRQGMLVTLRGVNLSPGADPEDMVSLRMWINSERIITTRRRRLLAVTDVCNAIGRGQGPRSPGELLVMVADRMADRIADVVETIDNIVDALEEQVITRESHQLRSSLARARRQAITLRRYLAPQREALSRLYIEKVPWLTDLDTIRIREITDQTTRYVEDLDAARDRAAVTHEELASRLSEALERRMFLLSVIAAVFLPLSFITGLLGINVGGIPGAEDPLGFVIVLLAMAVILVIQLWFFKYKRWF